MIRSLIGALALAVPFAAMSASQNLLVNPGAETGDLTGWTVGGTASLIVADGPQPGPFEGKYYFAPTNSWPGERPSVRMSQTVSLEGMGQPVSAHLSFMAIADGRTFSDEVWANLRYLDKDGKEIGSAFMPDVAQTRNWTRQNHDFVLPEATRKLELTFSYVLYEGTEITAYVDDASLTVSSVPEAGGVWLGLSGLAALGLLPMQRRMRRRAASAV